MKRLHIHIAVENINESIRFYNSLFGSKPTKVKDDYAQWLLDDPAMNFAISSGRNMTGLNHLGFQVDSDAALQEIETRLNTLEQEKVQQEEAACCYAKSKKCWIQDPQGVIWENYHTMEQIEVFGGDEFTGGSGCCQPTFSENGKWATTTSCD